MKLTVQGKGDVNLSKRDFVAAGGEGSVYAKGSTAYKVYTDPKKMIPVGKIRELGVLTDPMIIRPQQVLVDKRGSPVGYTMRYLPDVFSLCQLFTRSFRDREGVTHAKAFHLVEKLCKGVTFCHGQKVLVVDLNEMNFVVDPKFRDVFFIDVDSYQTRSYPATALMESVKDWQAKGNWNEGSDWFSYAVVSFQTLVGIHPYRGKYKGSDVALRKKLPTDDPADSYAVTRRRMKANISVFSPDVGLPGAAYPFDVIPDAWRSWYEAVFERGERCPPPSGVAMVAVVRPVVRMLSKSTQNLIIGDVGWTGDGDVTGVWVHQATGNMAVATAEHLWWGSRRMCSSIGLAGVAFSPQRGRPVAVSLNNQTPELLNVLEGDPIPFGLYAEKVVVHDGRIYAKAGDQILEIVLTDAGGNKVLASPQQAASVLPKASYLFPGGCLQNALGSTYAHLFPASGVTIQARLNELDGYRVVEARYDSGVLMVVAEKKGKYDRLVYRVDDVGQHDVRVVPDVTPTGLNFVVLDTGICVCLNEDESLELFSSKRGSPKVKVVDDTALSGPGGMQLHCRGGELLFSRGDHLYTMKMR